VVSNHLRFILFASLAVAHALLVLVSWWAMFYAHVEIFSARAWLILAWLWVFWPFMIYLHPARSALPMSVALVIGALLLVPCAPTIFAFTVWSVRGFAP
jgi:hypothetical protein